jgi:hypothetical protein
MSGIELVRIDTNILPKAKLLVVFAGLAFALLVAFIDQNSIGIALPTIGADLHAATTISWGRDVELDRKYRLSSAVWTSV